MAEFINSDPLQLVLTLALTTNHNPYRAKKSIPKMVKLKQCQRNCFTLALEDRGSGIAAFSISSRINDCNSYSSFLMFSEFSTTFEGTLYASVLSSVSLLVALGLYNYTFY